MIIPNASEDAEKLYCFYIAMKWCTLSVKQFDHSYKTKHATISDWTLGCLSQSNENLCSYNNLNMSIHSSFLFNSKKLKELRCPSAGDWLNRQWSIHAVESCSVGKEQTINTGQPG